MQSIISVSNEPTALDPENTSANKQGVPPSTVIVVKTPLPAGIKAPENEKPITLLVVEDAETEKPAAAAAPPDALIRFAPLISNWKPPIGKALLYRISIVD